MIDMLPPPPSRAPEMEIREMTAPEIEELAPIFAERGGSLPDPRTSSALGVFKHGKRVAFIFLQIKLHAEPMLIEEGHSEVFRPLVAAAEKHILEKCGPQFVYLFAPAGRVSQLASSMGMQLEPYCIYSKLVMPDVPKVVPIDLSSMPLGENPAEEVIQ